MSAPPKPEYLICRVEKIGSKAELKRASDHNARNNKPKNADPSRANLNELEGDRDALKTWEKHIDERIDKPNKDGKKYAANSVVALEVFVGTSGNAEVHPKDLLKYAKRFVEKRFGKANILQIALHLDEETPHIHILLIPIATWKNAKGAKKTTLTAKRIIGGKADEMVKLQDMAWEEIGKPLGLVRGELGSLARHITTTEYQATQVEIEKEFAPPEPKPFQTAKSYKITVDPIASKMKKELAEWRCVAKKAEKELRRFRAIEKYHKKMIQDTCDLVRTPTYREILVAAGYRPKDSTKNRNRFETRLGLIAIDERYELKGIFAGISAFDFAAKLCGLDEADTLRWLAKKFAPERARSTLARKYTGVALPSPLLSAEEDIIFATRDERRWEEVVLPKLSDGLGLSKTFLRSIYEAERIWSNHLAEIVTPNGEFGIDSISKTIWGLDGRVYTAGESIGKWLLMPPQKQKAATTEHLVPDLFEALAFLQLRNAPVEIKKPGISYPRTSRPPRGYNTWLMAISQIDKNADEDSKAERNRKRKTPEIAGAEADQLSTEQTLSVPAPKQRNPRESD